MSISAFVWVVDPYQFYRRNDSYAISGNFRFQNPGLAKHYEYETILLGTSISHGTRPSIIDSVFNTKTMKLTMKGSTNHEQALMAEISLKTGKPKHVIWGIDYFTCTRENFISIKGKGQEFPYYLYDNNMFNDWEFLFNISNLKYTLGKLKESEKKIDRKQEFNHIESQYTSKTGLETILKRANIDFYDLPGSIEKVAPVIKENIDINVFETIRRYPNVKFDIYLSPYTILFMQEESVYERNKVFKEYLVSKLAELRNVTIHDFQQEEKITWDFNNYVDRYHYIPKVGDYIIRHIKKGDYVVHKDKLELNDSKLLEQISRFSKEKP